MLETFTLMGDGVKSEKTSAVDGGFFDGALKTIEQAIGAERLRLLAPEQDWQPAPLEMVNFSIPPSVRNAQPRSCPQYAAELDRVRVVGGIAAVLDGRNGEIISDAVCRHRADLNIAWYGKYGLDMSHPQRARCFTGRGTPLQVSRAVSLFSWENRNYAHWLIEKLASFCWIAAADLPKDTVLLVEAGLPATIIESLCLFWPAERILFVDPGVAVEVEQLYYFSEAAEIWEPRDGYVFDGNDYRICPQALRWVAQAVRERVLQAGQVGVPKGWAYLVRPSSSIGRAVVNQGELVEMLGRQGYDCIQPATMRFAEQVAYFAELEHVVSPSGAAVANLLWMRAGTSVVVLLQDIPQMMYWFWHALAAALGVRLVFFPIQGVPSPDRVRFHWDTEVPLPALGAWLAQAFPMAASQKNFPVSPKLEMRVSHPDEVQRRQWNQQLVSVCITAYNHEAYVEQALDSVLAQTWPHVEILVVDDASQDGTAAAIEACALKHPGRIRVVLLQENEGPSRAINRLIQMAQGRFVALLGSDDRMRPERLRRQVEFLTANPQYVGVFSDVTVIDAQGQVNEQAKGWEALFNQPFGHVRRQLLDGNFLNAPSAMVRREDLLAVGAFSPLLRYVQDYELWGRLLHRGELAKLPEPLTEYRVHGANLSMFGGKAPNFAARCETVAVAVQFTRLWPLDALLARPLVTDRDRAAALLELAELLVNLDRRYLERPSLGCAQAYDLALQASRLDPLAVGPAKLYLEACLEQGFSNEVFPLVPDGVLRLAGSVAVVAPSKGGNEDGYVQWLGHRRISSASPLFDRYTCRASAGLNLCVLIAGGGDAQALERTQASLRAQYRQADSVWLAHEQDLTGLPKDARSWFLLLHAGDMLELDALLTIESVVAGGLARLAYFDHDGIDAIGRCQAPCLKPAPNPDLLLSYPYVGRALALRADVAVQRVVASAGGFDLSLAYELALTVLGEHGLDGMLHIPALLAHLSDAEPAVFGTTTPAWQALAGVLAAHLQVHAFGAQVLEGPGPGTFHVVHPLPRTPKVSIVIPTRDQLPFLSRCIETLLDKTDYPDFEILVVDNDSQTPEAQAFLAGMEVVDPERIRVLRVPGAFNFSRMNNLAVAQARGEFILLLNNDTAALHADWLSHMVRHALRDGVGIVGARLLYPEGTVQHAGVIMGLRGPAEHPCLGLKADEPGYMFRAQVTQDFSAVTAACMLVSKAVYEEVGGLDEDVFAVSYNDVDFCLRVGRTGRRIVWTPLATLLHEGSASQKASIENLASDKKAARFTQEQAAMYQRWPDVIANDPAYNPNLTLVERGYEVETNPLLCHDPLKGLVDHRVVVFAADAFGCGHYRILQPMQAMLDAGLCSGGSSPELFGPHLALRSGADTLVFQRPTTDAALALLESLLPLKGIRKIYEVDDDLSRVPMKSAHREHMPKDIRARMIRNIGLCDRLVVSTEFLAQQFKGSNDDIRVVPNRLPPAMWGERPPIRQARDRVGCKPVVGWAGGASHRGDLDLIAQVVRETADQVDWVFMGMCPESIRPYVKAFHEGVPTLEYPRRLMELSASWDLAVAPLEVNAFNEAKSNLRLLEYGWCGLPVVCTDITPYQGDLPVVRVKNRYKDWRNAILEAVDDLEGTLQLGQALQERVASDWTLKDRHLEAWYQAWTAD